MGGLGWRGKWRAEGSRDVNMLSGSHGASRLTRFGAFFGFRSNNAGLLNFPFGVLDRSIVMGPIVVCDRRAYMHFELTSD